MFSLATCGNKDSFIFYRHKFINYIFITYDHINKRILNIICRFIIINETNLHLSTKVRNEGKRRKKFEEIQNMLHNVNTKSSSDHHLDHHEVMNVTFNDYDFHSLIFLCCLLSIPIANINS